MKYEYAGGIINVPQSYIDRTIRSLDCTVAEACELYLSDEGYVENETVVKLTEKANGTKRTRQVKPDYTKIALIKHFYNAVREVRNLAVVQPDEDGNEVQTAACDAYDVSIDNPQRIISFSIGDDRYELTLSKKRKPKK